MLLIPLLLKETISITLTPISKEETLQVLGGEHFIFNLVESQIVTVMQGERIYNTIEIDGKLLEVVAPINESIEVTYTDHNVLPDILGYKVTDIPEGAIDTLIINKETELGESIVVAAGSKLLAINKAGVSITIKKASNSIVLGVDESIEITDAAEISFTISTTLADDSSKLGLNPDNFRISICKTVPKENEVVVRCMREKTIITFPPALFYSPKLKKVREIYGPYTIQSGKHFIADALQFSTIAVKKDDKYYNKVSIHGGLVFVAVPKGETAEIRVDSDDSTISGYIIDDSDKFMEDSQELLILHKSIENNQPELLTNNEMLMIYNEAGVSMTLRIKRNAHIYSIILKPERSIAIRMGNEPHILASPTFSKDEEKVKSNPSNFRIKVSKEIPPQKSITVIRKSYFRESLIPSSSFYFPLLTEIDHYSSRGFSHRESFIVNNIEGFHIREITMPVFEEGNQWHSIVPIQGKLSLIEVPKSETAFVFDDKVDKNLKYGYSIDRNDFMTDDYEDVLIITRDLGENDEKGVIKPNQKILLYNKASVYINIKKFPSMEEIIVDYSMAIELVGSEKDFTSFTVDVGYFSNDSPPNVRVTIHKNPPESYKVSVTIINNDQTKIILPPSQFYRPYLFKVTEFSNPKEKTLFLYGPQYFIGNNITNSVITVNKDKKQYEPIQFPNKLVLFSIPKKTCIVIKFDKNTYLFGYEIEGLEFIDETIDILVIHRSFEQPFEINSSNRLFVYNKMRCDLIITLTRKDNSNKKTQSVMILSRDCHLEFTNEEVESLTAKKNTEKEIDEEEENIFVTFNKSTDGDFSIFSENEKGEQIEVDQNNFYIKQETPINPEKKQQKTLGGGAIAGIVIACLCFISIICFVVYWYFYHNPKDLSEDKGDSV